MTIEAAIEILENNTMTRQNKIDMLEEANLSYSVLFKLQEKYKYNNEIYNMLSYFTFYEDDRLTSKISIQNKKNYSNVVYHKKHHKRRKINDKYKRR